MLTELGQLYSFSRHPLVVSRTKKLISMSEDDDQPSTGTPDLYLNRDAYDKTTRLVLVNVVLFCSLGMCIFLEILLIARDSLQIIEKRTQVICNTQQPERFIERWELFGRIVCLVITLCICYVVYRRSHSIDYDTATYVDLDQTSIDGESIICPFVVKFFDAYLDIEHEGTPDFEIL